MTIPTATTTVLVEQAAETEPGEGRTWTEVARDVRAVIGSPSGGASAADGGGSSAVQWRLDADPISDLTDTCRVTDQATGVVYEVDWVAHRAGFGLDHTVAGIRVARGAVA